MHPSHGLVSIPEETRALDFSASLPIRNVYERHASHPRSVYANRRIRKSVSEHAQTTAIPVYVYGTGTTSPKMWSVYGKNYCRRFRVNAVRGLALKVGQMTHSLEKFPLKGKSQNEIILLDAFKGIGFL